MARQLENLGVDIIEASFPIASEGDFIAVRAISEMCETTTVAAICRTTENDIARATEALKKAGKARIHTFVATSDIHLEYNLQKTRRQVLEMTRNAVRHNNSLKSNLLPVVLSEEKVAGLVEKSQNEENYELTVDLQNQTVSDIHGFTESFKIDEFRKYCLLNGLDDIGLTLQNEAKISEYENLRKKSHGFLSF